jgi:hypothetical protein
MKHTNRTAGIAAAASFALALAAAACGESSSITNPTPPPAAPPAPAATFAVSGTISEATESGSMPLEGASGLNWATDEATTTDGNGYYSIGGLRTGLAQLMVAKEGYEERLIEVMIDGDAQVDAVLVRQSESN